MRTVAHISDLHIGSEGGRYPQAVPRAQRVLEYLSALDPRPDVLVISGDLSDDGTAQQYHEVRSVLAQWPGPWLACPGNRDVRADFAQGVLGVAATDSPLDQVHEVAGLRLILLDSSIPGSEGQFNRHGELSSASLGWLDDELSESNKPTVIVVHHHPITLGNPSGDDSGLANGPQLEKVLERHPHVIGTLIGHVHAACATTFAGRPLLVGGGVVATANLDCEQAIYGRQTQHPQAPPTLALHFVDDNNRIITHWRVVD